MGPPQLDLDLPHQHGDENVLQLLRLDVGQSRRPKVVLRHPAGGQVHFVGALHLVGRRFLKRRVQRNVHKSVWLLAQIKAQNAQLGVVAQRTNAPGHLPQAPETKLGRARQRQQRQPVQTALRGIVAQKAKGRAKVAGLVEVVVEQEHGTRGVGTSGRKGVTQQLEGTRRRRVGSQPLHLGQQIRKQLGALEPAADKTIKEAAANALIVEKTLDGEVLELVLLQQIEKLVKRIVLTKGTQLERLAGWWGGGPTDDRHTHCLHPDPHLSGHHARDPRTCKNNKSRKRAVLDCWGAVCPVVYTSLASALRLVASG